jgi:hypothetical protein
MFANSAFNRPLNAWVIANPIDENGGVEDMHGMFENNHVFNQSLSNWFANGADDGVLEIHADVDDMFSGASSFNQNLSRWEVHLHADQSMFSSNGTDMSMNQAYMPIILAYDYPDDPDEPDPELEPAFHAPADGRAYNVHNVFATINMDALMAIIGPPINYAGAQPFDEFLQDRLAELITTLPLHERDLLSGRYNDYLRVCLHNVQPQVLYNTVMHYITRQGLSYQQNYIRSFITDSMSAYGDVENLDLVANRSCARGVSERIVTSMGPAGVGDDAYIPLNRVLIPPLSRSQVVFFGDRCRENNAAALLALGDTTEGSPEQAEKARILRDCMRSKLIEERMMNRDDPDPQELTNYLNEFSPYLGGKKTRNRNKQKKPKRKTIKQPKRKQTKRKKIKRKQTKRTR